jgi:hypothetical protein
MPFSNIRFHRELPKLNPVRSPAGVYLRFPKYRKADIPDAGGDSRNPDPAQTKESACRLKVNTKHRGTSSVQHIQGNIKNRKGIHRSYPFG